MGRRRGRLILAMVLTACVLTACDNDTNVMAPTIQVYEVTQPVEETAGMELSEDILQGEISQGELQGEMLQGEVSGEMADNRQTGSGGKEREDMIEDDDGVITITISAAGDCSLGNHHEQDYYSSFRQAYDKAEDEGYFFENVLDIFSYDDMTIVNLEGVLTFSEERKEDRTYNIKGDPAYARLLTAGSVEAVSMGNNHRMDYGEAGCRDTVAALEQEGVVYAYDSKVGIYETKGIRIGFVSVDASYLGIAVEKKMEAGINKLKEEGVDLILACCHWGTEREYYPEEYQTILGKKCIDWGADLVLGHHPHVLQGVDKYNGKYIVYSLSNFCFGANRNPEDKDTMIFRQTFTFRDGVKEEDDEVRIIPCSVSSVQNRNDFKPTPALGEEAIRIIGRVNEFSAGFGVAFDEEGWVVK